MLFPLVSKPAELLNDKKLSSEAPKNQTAFGNTGKRNGFPPNPNDNPNGSFHNPKPQVPDIESLDARADKLKLSGARKGNLFLASCV